MGAVGLAPGAREYSPEEISACLGIPVSQAEEDLQRALVKGSRNRLVAELADERIIMGHDGQSRTRMRTTTSVASDERGGM